MSTYNINGAIEFVSIQGEPGGVDALINAWARFHPDTNIIDIKYQTIAYQDDDRNILVKSVLVLFHKEDPGALKSIPKDEQAATPTQEKQEPGARTMVQKWRKDMDTADDIDSEE